MKFQTLIIGRSRRADIRLGDATVSRLHAELTVTASGRYYLTDRASLRGTSVRRDGEWVPHRQGYVGDHERVRFGQFETELSQLFESR